ncbi:MAG: metallophosphoesterase [Bacteroidales bacterium]|nr:metallophosphoesterase [Bacteroidales bacterium]
METIRTGKLLIVFLLFYLITGTGNAQKKKASDPYFFIQLTDPQFGMLEANYGFEKETYYYERAVKEINRLKPDFVMITGDLVNKKGNKSQIAEFKRITKNINRDIPVYLSPGNHDIGQAPEQKDIDAFIAEYGYDRIAFKHKGSLFIGINSNIIKANTPVLEPQQFKWLKKELSKGKASKHIVIFCHHPFFKNAFDEPEGYFNIGTETRNKYLALFKEYNVDAIFAGHLHDNGFARYGNLEMVTTSAVGMPLSKPSSGIRIVKVYSNRLESDFYGLTDIPESVILQDN